MPPRGLVGQILGHYRIDAPLGAGGMGEVYRGRDLQLERDVAIKILPTSTAADPTARARLLREARTASQLNHPNICTIHEVGEDNGQAFIAMELVDGQPLSAALRRGPLPPDEVVRFGLQLADALAHAHRNNVVHRDLKSGNVLVTPEGRVKVLDFGLAKRMAEASTEAATESRLSLTQPGAIVGTLAYMAPEQLRGQPADARADVWALGVVLYELAAGALPFRGQNGLETSLAIVEQRPTPLPETVPPPLCAVIDRCLEKEPTRRYQNGGELKAALETAQADAVPPPAILRRPFRRPTRAVLAIVVLLAVGTAIGLNLERLRGRFGGGRGIESIAVLPLDNLSGDPRQEYFTDGMTEALITDLGRLTGLKKVIARSSVARYKGSKASPRQIARDLSVDALITGAVARSEQRVRLTAQLVDPNTGAEIWSQKYERDLRDVLQLQAELTRAIADGIRLKLAPSERTLLARGRPVDPQAYDAYLQGRFHWQKATRREFDIAEKYFQLALEKDPNYALAYGGLGIVWGLRCVMGVVPCAEAVPKWKEAVRKALELEPDLPEAQAQAAAIMFYADWNWGPAGTELQRAIARDPNYPEAHVWYSYWLFDVGRPQEGLAETRRALELDPFNSTYKWYVGEALLKTGDVDAAIASLRELARTDPGMPRARSELQLAFEKKQMYAQAMAQWRQTLAASADTEVVAAVERGYAEGGYREAMRRRAELAVERSRTQYVRSYQIAAWYAAAGDQARAIDYLERALEERDSAMVHLRATPRFDSLRDQPRFKALLRRMNLP